MIIFKKLFKKEKLPDSDVLAQIYHIPLDLVKNILKYKKHGDNFWNNLADPTTEKDYENMLMGASITYNNQTLMGRKLPIDDERVVELCKYMASKGIAIQYHPYHGMCIIETKEL